MLFNTFNFWLIFPFIFGIYWLIPYRYNVLRKLFLLIVSYLLYMNWKPAYGLVLLFVSLITYGGGIYLVTSVIMQGDASCAGLSPCWDFCRCWYSNTITS